ncbi:class D beta-lactamase [Candidatus Colwellia aromaticivorans]|uniref:class D beta-lactamase n=1 Tax=Candidatus Colwellia aromaticivorans TaxID=2267621 RepID=UPI0014448B8D|nr:class D beta-lactamase [Candidatus Colwellia aromaticivorans]
MKVIKLLLTTALLGYYSHFALASDNKGLCQEGDNSCTFVLLTESRKVNASNKGNISTVNEARANTQLSPFSTFKVTNSLIALDLGVIKNTKQVLTYDEKSYPKQVWWPSVWKLPHYDLTTAFKYSMVAIYRQLATDIGEKSMSSYLNKMHYGNQDISSGLDNFWLNGSLKISAVEQIGFLQKIYHNKFAFNEQAIDSLKEVMLIETKPSYRLFAKTGAGKLDDGTMLGWYIGFVENSAGVHFFAFNFDSPSYGEMKAKRTKQAKSHLRQAGIIE